MQAPSWDIFGGSLENWLDSFIPNPLQSNHLHPLASWSLYPVSSQTRVLPHGSSLVIFCGVHSAHRKPRCLCCVKWLHQWCAASQPHHLFPISIPEVISSTSTAPYPHPPHTTSKCFSQVRSHWNSKAIFSTASGVPSVSLSRTSVQPQCHPGECHHLSPIHVIQKPGTPPAPLTSHTQSRPFHLPNIFCIHPLFYLHSWFWPSQFPFFHGKSHLLSSCTLWSRGPCWNPFVDPHALGQKTSIHLVARKAPACLQLVKFLLLSAPPTTNPQLPTPSPHSACCFMTLVLPGRALFMECSHFLCTLRSDCTTPTCVSRPRGRVFCSQKCLWLPSANHHSFL